MNANDFKNVFISHSDKNIPLDSTFIINDSIFENNEYPSFYLDNQLNPNIFQIKERYLNDINNLELNNIRILSDKTKPSSEINNLSKKDKPLDNHLIDYSFINNNSKENHNQNNNLLKKESLRVLDSPESQIISKPKKKRGRKSKKIDDSYTELNKFTNDNIIRKCKTLVLTYSLEFLNHQIKKIYDGDIGRGIQMKKLLDISQEYKADNTINFMRKFIKKTLKEIFSVEISSKYTSFLANHNEVVIKKILNDKDDDKRKKFEKLINLTFIDCLNKFKGENDFEEFDGFPTFDDVKNKINDESKYLEKIKEALINFEDIIKNTKPRFTKTKKIKNE